MDISETFWPVDKENIPIADPNNNTDYQATQEIQSDFSQMIFN